MVEAAEEREAATLAALFEAARLRQEAAQRTSPGPPRFLLESAQSMARHMAMPETDMRDRLAPMAFWQLYLPSALGAGQWDFGAVRDGLPWSYQRVHAALSAVEAQPQVVSTVFHMAAFPLVCVLVGTVWRDLHEGPLHLLVASRNLAWFRSDANGWVSRAVTVHNTSPAGLRRLIAGLKQGSVRRLLILPDGPHPPGVPGTRSLDGISPALGVRTTLLARVHALGIPIVPIGHEWESGRLVVTPRQPLDSAGLSEAEAIDAVVRPLEDLLRRRSEQWLNWGAARLRT